MPAVRFTRRCAGLMASDCGRWAIQSSNPLEEATGWTLWRVYRFHLAAYHQGSLLACMQLAQDASTHKAIQWGHKAPQAVLSFPKGSK